MHHHQIINVKIILSLYSKVRTEMTDCNEISLLRNYSRSCRIISNGTGGSNESANEPIVLWSDGTIEQIECEMLVGQEKTLVQKIALSDQYYISLKKNSSNGSGDNSLNKFYQVLCIIRDLYIFS